MAPKKSPKDLSCKKPKHKTSVLAKAVKTQRHDAPTSFMATNTVMVDMKTSAATPEFKIEEIGVGARGLGTTKCSTKTGMKTAFGGESFINVDRRIRNAAIPIGATLDDGCEVEEDLSIERFDLSSAAKYFMPRRPAWNYELSSGRLHFREAQGFQQWLADVRQRMQERGGYPPVFEQNLQVWRQLWRVLERCDVGVVVLDARHPLLHLPPALVFHITRTLQKPLVLVLNKLDMVDPQNAKQWSEVLKNCVPGVMGVVGYSKEPLRDFDFEPLAMGKAALIAACHKALEEFNVMRDEVAMTSRGTPASAAKACAAARAFAMAAGVEEPWIEEMEGVAEPFKPWKSDELKEDGRILLGLIGHPNVGKSSIVNSLVGEKVVSVKATPGHTKTLQTMFLDERTCLFDSPGVVFPRLEVPREAQIVGMLIPHGQVREPFSAIRWVMEHATTPLNELLGLKPTTLQQVLTLHEQGTDCLRLDKLTESLDADDVVPWSPMLICAQYAIQRGLVRYGRPNTAAAGLEILMRVLEGRVPYSVSPPDTSVVPEQEAEYSDSDGSDWQIDDADFESEPEIDPADKPKDLLTVFGEEAKVPGSCTIRSRKKQEKKKLLAALEAGESKKAEKEVKYKATEEELFEPAIGSGI